MMETILADNQALAAMVKRWRKSADLNTAVAGEMLGIPARTVEHIEAGRGFRYPRLLVLAIRAFWSTPDPLTPEQQEHADD